MFRAAKQNRIFQDVVDQIEEAILAGQLQPGDTLPPERDLRAEFLAVMTQEVAGVYVPYTGALYVVEDAPVPFSLRVASLLSTNGISRRSISFMYSSI